MKISRIAILLILGLVNINKVSINEKSFLDCMLHTGKVPTRIFGNVRCPILRIKTSSTLQCSCGIASDILNKSRLNCKLKISNTADNVI